MRILLALVVLLSWCQVALSDSGVAAMRTGIACWDGRTTLWLEDPKGGERVSDSSGYGIFDGSISPFEEGSAASVELFEYGMTAASDLEIEITSQFVRITGGVDIELSETCAAVTGGYMCLSSLQSSLIVYRPVEAVIDIEIDTFGMDRGQRVVAYLGDFRADNLGGPDSVSIDGTLSPGRYGVGGFVEANIEDLDGLADCGPEEHVRGTWSVTISPVPTRACSLADVTGQQSGVPDGLLNFTDFAFFLSAWAWQEEGADITATGLCDPFSGGDGVDLSDMACYLAYWSSGCGF